jgi:iron complex transport system permease protein
MNRLNLILALGVLALLTAGLFVGEVNLTAGQIGQAIVDPGSGPGDVLWSIRAPRTVTAAVVGAALGLAGAVMQGLLRNPLADPGVLGVSGGAGLGAALAISLGSAMIPGAVEGAALAGALAVGALLTAITARFREPETLILFGVAISAFAGAVTSLVFNFAPSPVTLAEVFSWLLGSVANRDWTDIGRALPAMVLGAGLCAYAGRGLVMLSLGEETARLSGLPMGAVAGRGGGGHGAADRGCGGGGRLVGFVGLAAPHLVRARVGGDPGRILLPSALAGAGLLILADLAARLIPTDVELKLGVVTALFGAPLFALIAYRAARSWRA